MKQGLVAALVALSFIYGMGAHFSARRQARGGSRLLRTLLLVSLTIWAGGNAVYVAAPDLSTALIWRRVSVLGWGTVFSLLLHLVM